MARSIAFPVGPGGANLPEDLELIRGLLNSIPHLRGGPNIPIAPGQTNDISLAIQHFQRTRSILPANGYISRESPTLYQLNLVFHESNTNSDRSESDPSGILSELRDRVCGLARSYVGHISDQTPPGAKSIFGERRGWQLLKQIFDEILPAPTNWSDTKEFPYKNPQLGLFNVTNLEGVQRRHMRVPQRNANGDGIQWCGMFATWIWRKAGLDIKWRFAMTPMISGNPVEARNDFQNMRHGDIGMIPKNSHHFIIMTDPATGKPDEKLHTVDGNSDYQEIREFRSGGDGLYSMHTIKELMGYYSLDQILKNSLPPKKPNGGAAAKGGKY